MEKKLYVGNISFKATEEDIRELFARSGEVETVKIITDAHTGNPKGFGFVEMATVEDAKKAIDELNGTTFHGKGHYCCRGKATGAEGKAWRFWRRRCRGGYGGAGQRRFWRRTGKRTEIDYFGYKSIRK